jgi:hypothetical protein
MLKSRWVEVARLSEFGAPLDDRGRVLPLQAQGAGVMADGFDMSAIPPLPLTWRVRMDGRYWQFTSNDCEFTSIPGELTQMRFRISPTIVHGEEPTDP